MKNIVRREFMRIAVLASMVLPITGISARAADTEPPTERASAAISEDGKKIALVTGATRGIGLEAVRQLAATGVHVLLGARTIETGEKLAAKFRAEGLTVDAIEVDLDDIATIQRAAKMIEERHGRLDILINNAGIFSADKDGLPGAADLETVKRILDVNFMGTAKVTQHMLPLIRKSARGRIVNVSSTWGTLERNSIWNDDNRWLGYNASKAAINMLTVQLAYELRNTPIKVNAVCPGYVATDMNEGQGMVSVADGARIYVKYALLNEDGPTGGLYTASGKSAW